MDDHQWVAISIALGGARQCSICGCYENLPHEEKCISRKLDDYTIAACLNAMKGTYSDMEWISSADRNAVEMLLSKPEVAADIVQRYIKSQGCSQSAYDKDFYDELLFCRWLLSNNIIDTSKLGGECTP